MTSIDIMDRLTVNITEDHIRRGERRTGERCPLALALNELTEPQGETTWFVHETVAELYEYWDLSQEAKDFVTDFDEGHPMQPCMVELYRVYEDEDEENS